MEIEKHSKNEINTKFQLEGKSTYSRNCNNKDETKKKKKDCHNSYYEKNKDNLRDWNSTYYDEIDATIKEKQKIYFRNNLRKTWACFHIKLQVPMGIGRKLKQLLVKT